MPFLAQEVFKPKKRSAFGSRPSDPRRFSTGGDHGNQHDDQDDDQDCAVVDEDRSADTC